MSATDPFPRDRFSATMRRMPRYGKLAWRLGRDPLVSRARRMAVLAAAAYFVSPIDAVPGVIPVVGQLDDIALMLAALRFALAGLDPVRRRDHLDAVDLRDEHLMEDVRTMAVTTAWVLRAGVRTTARVTRRSARIGAATAVHGGRVVDKAGHVVTEGAGAAARGIRRVPRPSLRRRKGGGHPDAGSGI